MKAGAQIVLAAVSSAFFKRIDNINRSGQRLDIVTDLRMSLERQNLAVDPKSVDTVPSTELKCLEKRLGIIQADSRKILHAFARRKGI
jgi:hypothetical protein